jgi:hypothetical protein
MENPTTSDISKDPPARPARDDCRRVHAELELALPAG